MRSKGAGLFVYAVLYLAFLYVPVLFLPLFSFNNSMFIAFPLMLGSYWGLAGVPLLVTREPGGTPIGEQIRHLLQFAPESVAMTSGHCALSMATATLCDQRRDGGAHDTGRKDRDAGSVGLPPREGARR